MILFDTEPDVAAFVGTNLAVIHGLEKIGSIKKDEKQAILLKTQLKILALFNQTTIQLQKYYGSS